MIKNLQAVLLERGRIKTGAKGVEITSKQGNKFRPPVKLDHFLLTTMERDANGDLMHDNELMDTLKASPDAIVNKDGNLTGIPIRLLYNDIQLNFPNRLSCYVGGRCVCSGDGEKAQTRDGREVKCPCEKIEFGYDGKEKCKYNGKLICVIDGTKSIGSCHVLRTTSINTVQSIIGGLSFVQAVAGGMLAFLPLQLVLTPRTTVTPSGAPVTVYISSIVYNGSIGDLRQDALGMAQDRAKYLIEMDSIEEKAKLTMATIAESEEEQREVQEEFYPDAIDVEVTDVKGSQVNDDDSGADKKKTDDAKKLADEKKLLDEKKISDKKTEEVAIKKAEREAKEKADAAEKKAEAQITVDDVKDAITDTVSEKVDTKKEDGKAEVEKQEPDTDLPKLAEPVPVTEAQIAEVKKLKKKLGIAKVAWAELVSSMVEGVTTVMDFTTEEAGEFIELLKAKEKKLAEDAKATLKEETTSETSTTITDDQKRLIIKLKKMAGIVDKAKWEETVSGVFPGITSVLDLTPKQADKFIEILKKSDDIPF